MPDIVTLHPELDAPKVAAGTLERVDCVVDQLCRTYSRAPAAQLLPQADEYVRHIRRLLSSPMTLSERRVLQVAAGWLSALLACLHFDVGNNPAARRSRAAAFGLGREAGHPELMGWAFEIRAWIALVEGEFRQAAQTARDGQLISTGGSVGVQLAVQEAKAQARLGWHGATEDALRRARAVLTTLAPTGDPSHHFVFDPTKLTFFAGTCYVWLGRDAIAEEHAREVITEGLASGRLTRSAEANVDLGLIALRRGELAQACDHGAKALDSQRPCATTLGRLAELDRALMNRHARAPEARDFHDRYLMVARPSRHHSPDRQGAAGGGG